MLIERGRPLRDRLPTAALLLASPLLLLASPYGFELVGYYHRLLLNPAFSQYVTEWAPTKLAIATAPFYFLGILAAWLAGRCAHRLNRCRDKSPEDLSQKLRRIRSIPAEPCHQ